MNLLQGKFEFWNKDTRICVCPVNYGYRAGDWDELIKNLTAMKFEIVGEIDMPINFGYRFLVAKIPDWLYVEADDDYPHFYAFKDPKGSVRFRVVGDNFMSSVVFTRYWPGDTMNEQGELVPCVYDLESDDMDLDDPEPIWLGERDESRFLGGRNNAPAAIWLDANYPDWRDPMAYWS